MNVKHVTYLHQLFKQSLVLEKTMKKQVLKKCLYSLWLTAKAHDRAHISASVDLSRDSHRFL